MGKIINFIFLYAESAPWVIFIAIILAGLNIPISIDILLVTLAFLTANFYPEKFYLLMTLFFLSTTISGWINYTIGRTLGTSIVQHRYLSKFITQKKLDNIQNFYDRWGALAYIIGRFIPFGMRNVIFLSSGISKVPFKKFAILDSIGCFLWCGTLFPIFFSISQNYHLLLSKLKQINLIIFALFILGVVYFTIKKTKSRPSE